MIKCREKLPERIKNELKCQKLCVLVIYIMSYVFLTRQRDRNCTLGSHGMQKKRIENFKC